MILTAQLRLYQDATVTTKEGAVTVGSPRLQQWLEPDPLKGELTGVWQDVVLVVSADAPTVLPVST